MERLLKYGTDLTQMAKEGKLDPVIERSKEIERVQQILCQMRKNNPCLVGDPGVGKTAIAEGLAQGIVDETVPLKLQGKKVITLEMGRLVAGTKLRGDFEQRLVEVIEEVKESDGEIILFIDELHTLIGAGSGSSSPLDAANILKPVLSRGEIKRRFQPVVVPEPTVDETIEILEGLIEKYEEFHGMKYEYEALVAASALSKKFISDGVLPDKAIDLIDEAGAKAQLTLCKKVPWSLKKNKCKTVTQKDIYHLISTRTGIPVEKLLM